MTKKRNKENQGLPKRWRFSFGAYRYQVPPGQEQHWDGKQTFKLGTTLTDAYRVWADRIGTIDHARTFNDLFDRYVIEEFPKLKPSTRRRYEQCMPYLRAVFGKTVPTNLKPRHVYEYADRRKKKSFTMRGKQKVTHGGPTAARHEVALLSVVCTRAVKWGNAGLETHPFKGEVQLEGAKNRERYVEDWEVVECLALPPMRKKGGVVAVQAYIRLKLLTGLRAGDMLRLRESDLRDDGIHVRTSKTSKPVIFEWSDDLRAAVALAKEMRPTQKTEFLFCNRYGEGHMNEQTGRAEGFSTAWQRFMDRVLKETAVKERFTEYDLRAKCASDAPSLERAQQLLAHADSRTTKRFYRRKPEIIRPAK